MTTTHERLKSWLLLFLLGAAIAADSISANYTFAHAPLEIFAMSKTVTMPVMLCWSILVSCKATWALKGSWVPAVMLSISVVLATYRPDLPWPRRAVKSAILSSVLAGSWPLLAEKVLDVHSQRSSAYIEQWLDGSDEAVEPLHNHAIEHVSQGTTGRMLRTVVKVSCISAAVLALTLCLTDEPGLIRHNFYLHEPPYAWLTLRLTVAVFRFVSLASALLLIDTTSATTTGLVVVCTYGTQMAFLTFKDLTLMQKLGVTGCVATTLWYAWTRRPSMERLRRDLALFGLNPSHIASFARFRVAALGLTATGAAALLVVLVTMSGTKHTTYDVHLGLNPVAPPSDAYLGVRPDATTIADLDLLISKCRGSASGLEYARNAKNCLDFLANDKEYLILPSNSSSVAPEKQAQRTTPTQPAPNLATNLPNSLLPRTVSACEGPVILYHIWWTGPPSWRTELFVKSYLYTQNLPCSRLWIWLNADADPNAISVWLSHPAFARFLPLLDTGAVTLKAWNLPPRVPLGPNVDPLDTARYYASPRPCPREGETWVADAVVRDSEGVYWIQFYEPGDSTQIAFNTVAFSDLARLCILHLHGGVYLDLDMLLLRDLRPLLLSGRPFAERWGAHALPGLYNNALVALGANSSMSSYLLLGGTRMGLMYHFMLLGRMMVAEGRDDSDAENGLQKLESAFFDPAWPRLDRMDEGDCTVPCLDSWGDVFRAAPVEGEWQSFAGRRVEVQEGESNRTVANFFRGAYAYHMHNQWSAVYEKGSWVDVYVRAHDRFFDGGGTNLYGERWNGPKLGAYEA